MSKERRITCKFPWLVWSIYGSHMINTWSMLEVIYAMSDTTVMYHIQEYSFPSYQGEGWQLTWLPSQRLQTFRSLSKWIFIHLIWGQKHQTMPVIENFKAHRLPQRYIALQKVQYLNIYGKYMQVNHFNLTPSNWKCLEISNIGQNFELSLTYINIFTTNMAIMYVDATLAN